jgi:hypothetical protein
MERVSDAQPGQAGVGRDDDRLVAGVPSRSVAKPRRCNGCSSTIRTVVMSAGRSLSSRLDLPAAGRSAPGEDLAAVEAGSLADAGKAVSTPSAGDGANPADNPRPSCRDRCRPSPGVVMRTVRVNFVDRSAGHRVPTCVEPPRAAGRLVGGCRYRKTVAVREYQELGGRYRLDSEVGRGGMAVVWRAHDAVLGRLVAVKVLAGQYVTDPEARTRIREEARAAARLSHPNIAQVHDFGEAHDGDDVLPYVVMELISGVSLARRLRKGPLPLEEALRCCAEVAAALTAAHAKGLVHRDIKPANVMLTRQGAKVVDFGIAAAATPGSGGGPVGVPMGTPAYIAPERLTGDGVHPATDVYALGVLLYQLVSGRAPWTAESITEMLDAHIYTEPDPLPALPGIPAAVIDLCHRCLRKDPAERPTAREAAVVLADAAGVQVVTADPQADLDGVIGLPDGDYVGVAADNPGDGASGPTGGRGASAIVPEAIPPSAALPAVVVPAVVVPAAAVNASGSSHRPDGSAQVDSATPADNATTAGGNRPGAGNEPRAGNGPRDARRRNRVLAGALAVAAAGGLAALLISGGNDARTSSSPTSPAVSGTSTVTAATALPPGATAGDADPAAPGPARDGSASRPAESTESPAGLEKTSGVIPAQTPATAVTSAAGEPPASPPPPPAPAPQPRTFTSAGGTVEASCTTAGAAQLVSYAATKPYKVDSVDDAAAEVVFRHGNRYLTMTVTCNGSTPSSVTTSG